VLAELVEDPGNRTGILSTLGGLPLEFVDFLEDLDGDKDVVVLKAEDRVGVVNQDVRVENVILDLGGRRDGGTGGFAGFGRHWGKNGAGRVQHVVEHGRTVAKEPISDKPI
jgi:hypothetical protein